MDQVFTVCFALGLFALFGVGAVLGWIAYLRMRSADLRIRRLESELHDLRAARVASASASGTENAGVARSQPMPASVPADHVQGSAAAPVIAVPTQVSTPSRAAAPPALPGHVLAASTPSATSASDSTPPELAASPPRTAFDLERWLGVRGAAVLGGVFLVIAGFLFLQYSIEKGYITPSLRLIIGAVTGVACVLIAHNLRRRAFDVLANALTGAGVVILYAVAWAAHVVYGKIDFGAAFVAMVCVTTLCGWLSYRHSSQLIAALGFVGGFATPLALSTGQDRPIGLFGYALLLDLGFLFVARKRRWPSIGMLGLGGTLVLQALWIFWRMEKDELAIGLAVLAIFALFFAVFAATLPSEERRRWIPAQTGALFLPFAFVVYFAQEVDLGRHIYPLAALAAVIAVAAGVLARLQKAPWLAIGTSVGSLALVFVWTTANAGELAGGRAEELVLCALVLTLVHHVFAELAVRAAKAESEIVVAAAINALGLLCVCVFASAEADAVPLWPWIPAFALLGLALFRQVALGAHFTFGILGGLCAGAGFAAWALASADVSLFPPAWLYLVILIGVAGLFLAAAQMRRDHGRERAFWAAAACALPALVAACAGRSLADAPRALVLAALLALGVQIMLCATGARSSILFAVAIVASAAAQAAFTRLDVAAIARSQDWTGVVLVSLGAVVLFTTWPFVRLSTWRSRSDIWGIAAAASLPWFVFVHELVVARHGPALRFATPFAFAFFTGILAWKLWNGEHEHALSESSPERAIEIQTKSAARAWFAAVALLYASFVVPLHVDREPVAVGMALFGLALSALWTRSDHRALKYAAVIIFVSTLFGLVLGYAFDAIPRAHWRIVNWHAYLFLLPAACALFAAWLLRTHEVARVRGFKADLYWSRNPIAAGVVGASGLCFAFAWLNLEVSDAFSSHAGSFRWSLHGAPAPDLALSIAWALYALLMLVVGVGRRIEGLRWSSLILCLLTIGRVFLFDLGHLEGLHRVASMLGLALSLLVVSFLYQRFVFRQARAAA